MTTRSICITGALTILLAAAGIAVARGTPHGPWVQLADGQRVRAKGEATVYLVEDGMLRPITYTAYVELWGDFRAVCVADEVPKAAIGKLLGDGTRLIRAREDPKVYLVESGKTKRHVVNREVFLERYGFTWDRVHSLPEDEVKAIPEDRDLD